MEKCLYLRLTVVVSLVWVCYQPAVVRSWWHGVRDPIVVIVVITFVTQSIFVGVHLGAVDDEWAVVLGILVTVTIATETQ